MRRLAFGLCAVVLSAFAAGCSYSERTNAVQGSGTATLPATGGAVATPGAEHYGDRAPSQPTTYVYRSY